MARKIFKHKLQNYFVIGAQEIIDLISAFLFLIMGLILIRQYLVHRVFDFLIFSTAYFSGFVTLGTVAIIEGISYSVILIQIQNITLVMTTIFLFYHALLTKWYLPPKPLLYTGLTYGIFLIILTLFWKKMDQPSNGVVLFVEVPHIFSGYYPKGAGITFEGVILYSSSYSHLWFLFLVPTILLLIYVYSTIEVQDVNPKIQRTKYYYIVAWTSYLIWAILALFASESLGDLSNVFILIMGIIIFSTAVVYPEALVLSKAQIYRATNLYKIIDKENTSSDFGSEKIRNYLKNIPKEYLGE